MRDGQRLRTWREAKQLEQAQLAEQLGVTQQTVSAWETGRSRPDQRLVSQLASILEIRESDLRRAIGARAERPPSVSEVAEKVDALEGELHRMGEVIAALARAVGMPDVESDGSGVKLDGSG